MVNEIHFNKQKAHKQRTQTINANIKEHFLLRAEKAAMKQKETYQHVIAN